MTKSFFSIWSAVSSANSGCYWTPRLRGRGTGTKYELGWRPSTIRSVIPALSNAKWQVGGRYGELMMGLLITRSDTWPPLPFLALLH